VKNGQEMVELWVNQSPKVVRYASTVGGMESRLTFKLRLSKQGLADPKMKSESETER